MTLVASILLLALSRAEIVQRMRAPVVTQSDGLVKVYADCAEDQRREYQSPMARFAADTVDVLYRAQAMKPVRFDKPGIALHVGDIRTNTPEVVTQVSTNASRVVSRIYVRSPGYADLNRLRLEVIKAFFRSVKGLELDDAGAWDAFRRADPRVRIAEERQKLRDWRVRGVGDDEENLTRARKVLEPGRATPEDVLLFSARLYLYPPQFDMPFLGRYTELSFRDAVVYAALDPRIRFMALFKAQEPLVFACGRGASLMRAAQAYSDFLQALADTSRVRADLEKLLQAADDALAEAYAEAQSAARKPI